MCSTTPRFSYGAPETRVRAVSRCTGMLTSDGYAGWVPGWGIPGYGTRVGGGRGIPVPSHVLGEGPHDSEAGPVTPLRGGGVGGHEEPGALQSQTTLALPGPAPCGRCLGPPLFSQNQVQTAKRRDLRSYSVKLVKTAECHRYLSIRPVIVPVLKTRPKSRLLKFLDFRFCQPSLTRN